VEFSKNCTKPLDKRAGRSAAGVRLLPDGAGPHTSTQTYTTYETHIRCCTAFSAVTLPSRFPNINYACPVLKAQCNMNNEVLCEYMNSNSNRVRYVRSLHWLTAVTCLTQPYCSKYNCHIACTRLAADQLQTVNLNSVMSLQNQAQIIKPFSSRRHL
jgi:hypothetical protein